MGCATVLLSTSDEKVGELDDALTSLLDAFDGDGGIVGGGVDLRHDLVQLGLELTAVHLWEKRLHGAKEEELRDTLPLLTSEKVEKKKELRL